MNNKTLKSRKRKKEKLLEIQKNKQNKTKFLLSSL